MVKYIYKTFILLIVFAAAFFCFAKALKSGTVQEGTELSVGRHSLPYITVTTNNHTVNQLFGYTGNIADNVVRDNVTPLDSTRTLALNIGGVDTSIIRIQYDIFDKDTNENYYTMTQDVPADKKNVEVFLDYEFKTSLEYIFSICATTAQGQKIHYFTRLKYYIDDSHLKEKYDFMMEFHNNTFNKAKSTYIEKNLEATQDSDNGLADVGIHSGVDLITWGSMSVKKLNEPIVRIVEYNMETACFKLDYFVNDDSLENKTLYKVSEFYRVRYAGGHHYLLNYRRTMDESFDTSYINTINNKIKIGMTPNKNIPVITDEKSGVAYFARNKNIYCFNMNKDKNTISKIYSPYDSEIGYDYLVNDSIDTRLLRIDESGNLYFAEYGYFMKGTYEGKCAIVLYKYNVVNNTLDELLYMPVDSSFEQLKEDFNSFGYVSLKNTYYFSLSNTMYSYNVDASRLSKIAENTTEKGLKIIPQTHTLAWSDSMRDGLGDMITIFDMESENSVKITAQNETDKVRLLGVINSDIVYGYVNSADIVSSSSGRTIPCYKVVIVDAAGNEKKKYEKKGVYITDAQIQGSVMTVKRVAKKNNSFTKIGDDNILNQEGAQKENYSIKSKRASKSVRDWYLSFYNNVMCSDTPKEIEGPVKYKTNEKSIHMDASEVPRFYVSAYGKTIASYENVAEAIKVADEQMGVVISSSHKVLWERGGSFLINSVAGIDEGGADVDLTGASLCAYMVLKANHVNPDVETIKSKNSVNEILGTYLKEPLKLVGVNLEEMLYFVSNNRFVIAMTSADDALVITGYDAKFIYVFNPDSKKSGKVKRKEMESYVKSGKNTFFSYAD